MHSVLQEICDSLIDLQDSIIAASTSDQTMTEIYGWAHAPLNRFDYAEMSGNIVSKIKDSGTDNIVESVVEALEFIPTRIKTYKDLTLPQLFTGNNAAASEGYYFLIAWITSTIEPIFRWESLRDNKALPVQLARRLRSIQAELDTIVPNKEILEEQIKLINDATDAAESLPTDMASLKEARAKINDISTSSAELFGKIGTFHEAAISSSKFFNEKIEETDKLVAQCEEAYRITTTKGLAAAFDQRANKLSNTMWIWVVGLLFSLGTGGLIGASRFEAMAKLLNSKPEWGVIWMEFALSILGLAAPIWFAWLATKQISQRFRLAEDYAFKATVAKAYEGYRKEAARIDSAFEARLFSSALARLDEAPLRLVGDDIHSSPWQEFFSSPAFQKALTTIPELKDKFVSLAKDGADKIKNRKKSEEIDGNDK